MENKKKKRKCKTERPNKRRPCDVMHSWRRSPELLVVFSETFPRELMKFHFLLRHVNRQVFVAYSSKHSTSDTPAEIVRSRRGGRGTLPFRETRSPGKVECPFAKVDATRGTRPGVYGATLPRVP